MKYLISFLLTLGVCSSHATLIERVAEADAYVRLGTPTQNYGTDTQIFAKNSGANSTTRKGYFRFDLSGIDLNLVSSATFALEMTTNNNGGNPQDPTPKAYTLTVWGLNDGHAGESWIEGNGGTDNTPVDELIWNNAPANVLGGNGIDAAAATSLGSFVTPEINPATNAVAQIINFSTSQLKDFVMADNDQALTLILHRSGNLSNNLGFASRENNTALKPTLRLDMIPEPASGGLFFCGLAVLLRRMQLRRKRS